MPPGAADRRARNFFPDLAAFDWDDGIPTTATVGERYPNPWGVHDMHGNVWEWVQDLYNERYPATRSGGGKGSTQTGHRVLRGGSWRTGPGPVRSAARHRADPEHAFNDAGFRIVMEAR